MNNNIKVIAELAQGFEGDFMKAKLLIQAAAMAGADAAKFQMVFADELATTDYKYYDLFKSLEITEENWNDLYVYAKSVGIELYTDIFGIKSLNLSQAIGIRCVKIHGTDISNVALLEHVAGSRVPKIILGAGGAHFNEITLALDKLKNKEVVILLGFQGYPTSTESNHVSRIPVLKNLLSNRQQDVKIGFADHADPLSPLRFAISAASIGAGAVVVEKHLTLGRNMKMEDHESALNPDDFEEFVSVMRNCAAAMGNAAATNDFMMTDEEIAYRQNIRRHVIATKNIKAGTFITADSVGLKRTSSTAPISDLTLVYNRKAKRDIQVNSPIESQDLI